MRIGMPKKPIVVKTTIIKGINKMFKGMIAANKTKSLEVMVLAMKNMIRDTFLLEMKSHGLHV